MNKTVSMFLLLSTLLSGCAVIDFLDGKHFEHNPDYDRPQYGGGYGGGAGRTTGGGHSH